MSDIRIYKFKNQTIRGIYVNDGEIVANVDLLVDWNKIISHLGAKARRNKSGRSKLGCGIELRLSKVEG